MKEIRGEKKPHVMKPDDLRRRVKRTVDMRGGGGWFQVAAAPGDKRKRRGKVAEEELGKWEELRKMKEDLVCPQRNVAERKEEEG